MKLLIICFLINLVTPQLPPIPNGVMKVKCNDSKYEKE